MKTNDLASTLFNQSFNHAWRTRLKIVLAILCSLSLGLMAACKPSSSATPNRDEFDSLLNEKNYAQIKAGKFLMGTPEESEEHLPDDIEDRERPQHSVLISKPFEMGKYEVTQPQWEAVMGTNPSAFKSQEMPVTNVSWHDVQEFFKRLEPLDDKYTYRLPTEAEWEYACRAGSTGNFTGEDFDPEDEMEREREMKKVREKGGARERKEEKEKEKKRDERKKGEAEGQDARMKNYYLLLAEKER
ncbi:MAG: formylglycine-generating enzyme family protein, partial [Acidobacteriota bacterium]